MKNSCKILHIIGGGEIGGAEKHVLSLLTGMTGSCFEPHLVCLTPGPFAALASNHNISAHTFPMHFPLDLSPLPHLVGWSKKQAIDLIHTHGSRANLLGRLSARWLGLPCVSTVHSSLAHDYLSPWSARLALGLDRLTLPLTAGIITVSGYLAREVALRGGKRIKTIYNGYSFNPSPPDRASARELFRKQWGIPAQALVVGTIGRLHPTKGQIYLIQAARHLQLKFPNLHLLLIGDGPLRQELSQELNNSSLPHTLTGYLPLAYEALPAMDLFVLPSVSEGMGLVLLEAMQAGIPIVASAVGGIPEVIRDGREGLLVPAEDVSELTSACTTVLENSNLSESLIRAGLRRCTDFSMDAMLKDTFQLYTGLLNGRNQRLP